MNGDQKKKLLQSVIEQVEAGGLTLTQKKQCLRMLKSPINPVADPRLQDRSAMREMLKQTVRVFPGMSLSAEQQEVLFVQINYFKAKLQVLKKEIIACGVVRDGQLRQMLKWNQRRMAATSKIVTANMGLVLAMARYVNHVGVEFTELVSDGGMTLMRATDRFDYTRGSKFSTYACRAIIRAMSRTARIWYRHRRMFPAQLETDWEKVDLVDCRAGQNYTEMIEEIKVVLERNLANLTEIEKAVIRLRFPFLDDESDRLTLKEAGAVIGLSKERVRQIQNKSLAKLRITMEQRIAY